MLITMSEGLARILLHIAANRPIQLRTTRNTATNLPVSELPGVRSTAEAATRVSRH